jgi:hypothetical protein
MLPRLANGGFHIVGQDDELGWSAVVKGAKAYDVDLSHSGRKIAGKLGESKGGIVDLLKGQTAKRNETEATGPIC